MARMRYGKNTGFDEGFVSYKDIEALVEASFGEAGCQYAVELAELDDFDAFANAMKTLGLPRCDGTGGTFIAASVPSEFVNAVLVMRYPFLFGTLTDRGRLEMLSGLARKTEGNQLSKDEIGEIRRNMFKYTYYDSIPAGWDARFGLEICEDIRTILESDVDDTVDPHLSKAIAGYIIEQVKEKYGTLRWYDMVITEDNSISEAMYNLNHVYEMLSSATCIECGATKDVFMTNGGWISPLCYKHLKNSNGESEAIDMFAKEHGYEKRWVGFELAEMIGKYLACSQATNMKTNPDEMVFTCYSDKGEEKRYPYKELLEEYPDLQVFRLMERDYNVVEAEIPTIEEIESKIAELNAQT